VRRQKAMTATGLRFMASRTSSNELADSVNTRPTTVNVGVLIDFKAHDVSESSRRAPCAVPRNDGGIIGIRLHSTDRRLRSDDLIGLGCGWVDQLLGLKSPLTKARDRWKALIARNNRAPPFFSAFLGERRLYLWPTCAVRSVI
jgi:hypothetical protein